MPAIIPGSSFAEVAQQLLDLADDRRHVRTSTDYPSLALVVPDYLYERWERYQSLESSPPTEPKKSGSKKL